MFVVTIAIDLDNNCLLFLLFFATKYDCLYFKSGSATDNDDDLFPHHLLHFRSLSLSTCIIEKNDKQASGGWKREGNRWQSVR
jgi:hypothetical protein